MLKGKVALVTGASRGIGRSIAVKFAQNGAKVVINYNGSEEKANETLKMVTDNNGEGICIKGDVSDMNQASDLIQEVIKQYGRIDILVNNAGITRDNLVMGISEEDFDSVIGTNLKGTFNCIKSVYRPMLKQRAGRIINMSSIVGLVGNAGQANYSASKAGVIGITKSVAKEVAKRGITVNAIAPGFIQTDMTDVLSDKVKDGMLAQIPMNRFGNPEDIANAALFLASDMASYITGQVITVDGGLI